MAESLQSAQDRARAKIQRPEGQGAFQKKGMPSLGGPRRSNGPVLILMGLIALTVLVLLWSGRQEAKAPAATPVKTAAPVPAPARTPIAARPAPADSGLQLQGVVMGGGAPYAMINGEILSTGDTIEGYTIESIQANYVTVRDSKGRTQAYRIYPEES